MLRARAWVETLAKNLGSESAVLNAVSRPPALDQGRLYVLNLTFPASEELVQPSKTPFYDEEAMLIAFLDLFKDQDIPHIVQEVYQYQLQLKSLTSMVLFLHDCITPQPFCQTVALFSPLHPRLSRTVLEYMHLASTKPSLLSLLVSTLEIETEEEWSLLENIRSYAGLVWLKRLPKQEEVLVQHGSLSWTFRSSYACTRYMKKSVLYEKREDRLLWVSVFFAWVRRRPEIIHRAPKQMVVLSALLAPCSSSRG